MPVLVSSGNKIGMGDDFNSPSRDGIRQESNYTSAAVHPNGASKWSQVDMLSLANDYNLNRPSWQSAIPTGGNISEDMFYGKTAWQPCKPTQLQIFKLSMTDPRLVIAFNVDTVGDRSRTSYIIQMTNNTKSITEKWFGFIRAISLAAPYSNKVNSIDITDLYSSVYSFDEAYFYALNPNFTGYPNTMVGSPVTSINQEWDYIAIFDPTVGTYNVPVSVGDSISITLIPHDADPSQWQTAGNGETFDNLNQRYQSSNIWMSNMDTALQLGTSNFTYRNTPPKPTVTSQGRVDINTGEDFSDFMLRNINAPSGGGNGNEQTFVGFEIQDASTAAVKDTTSGKNPGTSPGMFKNFPISSLAFSDLPNTNSGDTVKIRVRVENWVYDSTGGTWLLSLTNPTSGWSPLSDPVTLSSCALSSAPSLNANGDGVPNCTVQAIQDPTYIQLNADSTDQSIISIEYKFVNIANTSDVRTTVIQQPSFGTNIQFTNLTTGATYNWYYRAANCYGYSPYTSSQGSVVIAGSGGGGGV